MTKEELEKEANKYAKEITEKYVFMDYGRASALGYLAGAEPREKRIKELEKENAELKYMKECPRLKAYLKKKKRNEVMYIKQLLRDIIISSGSDREELLKEAEQFLKEADK